MGSFYNGKMSTSVRCNKNCNSCSKRICNIGTVVTREVKRKTFSVSNKTCNRDNCYLCKYNRCALNYC